jgi:hypothetical protein
MGAMTIGAVARLSGVTLDTIRYDERFDVAAASVQNLVGIPSMRATHAPGVG